MSLHHSCHSTIHHCHIISMNVLSREAVGDTRANAKLQAGFAGLLPCIHHSSSTTDLQRSSMDWPRIPSRHVSRCQKPQFLTMRLFVDRQRIHLLIWFMPWEYPPFSACFFGGDDFFGIRIMSVRAAFVLPRLEISKPRYDYYVQVIGWRYDCWLIVGGWVVGLEYVVYCQRW